MRVRVAVVQIGVMWVAVRDRLMLVPVAVGLVRRIGGIMGVLVVEVVVVAMFVLLRRVAMAVLMGLSKV